MGLNHLISFHYISFHYIFFFFILRECIGERTVKGCLLTVKIEISFSWGHENGAFSAFRFSLLVFQPGIAAVWRRVRSRRVFFVQSSKETGENKNALNARFCAKENIAFMRICA